MDTPVIVQIDGGIGRVLTSTFPLFHLAKNKKVIVLTSCPEVFWNNDSIYKLYGLGNNDYLWDDVIRHGEFLLPEPYHNYLYYTQKHHLSMSFNHILNGIDDFSRPLIFLSGEEKEWANQFINARRKDAERPVVMLQWHGSGAFMSGNDVIDPSYRSLPLPIIHNIVENTNCTYINVSKFALNGKMNVWHQEFSLRQIFALTEQSDFVITVDSLLSHVGAAFNRRGLLLLGGTYDQNVGYPNYRMLSRDGYPKGYHPNRFRGSVANLNRGAMDFSPEDVGQIVNIINRQEFSCAEKRYHADVEID